MKTHIKKGDLVKVIAGSKERQGKVGKVLAVFPKTCRVKVEGVAFVKRHLKPQTRASMPEGGIVEQHATIHISNVMLMSESQNRPVRTGVKILEDGKKVRVAKGKNVKEEVLA